MELSELLKITNLPMFAPKFDRKISPDDRKPVELAEVVMPLTPMGTEKLEKHRFTVYVLGIEQDWIIGWGPSLICSRVLNPDTGVMVQAERYRINQYLDSYRTIERYKK